MVPAQTCRSWRDCRKKSHAERCAADIAQHGSVNSVSRLSPQEQEALATAIAEQEAGSLSAVMLFCTLALPFAIEPET